MTKINSLLKSMSLSELLLGIIILKEGNQNFDEDALELGLRKTSEKYDGLKGYFNVSKDMSGSKSTSLDNYMFFLGMSAIADTGDYQFKHMTKAGREYTERQLKKQYGRRIFEKIKPVANEVWNEAKKHKSYLSLAK